MQEKPQGFFHFGSALELTTDSILPYRFDHRLFFQHGFVFIVELKFDLHFLILFNAMQSGNRETNTASRDIVDVDNAAADPAFTGNFIRSGQAGLFAVRTAESRAER